MAQIGASRSVAVHMLGKLKTVVQMVAIPFLLYHGMLFGVIDTQRWGTVLIWISAVLTIWSMVYYLQKALPEIRARVSRDGTCERAVVAGTGDALGLRADLEHRLRRRPAGDAALAAVLLPRRPLRPVGGLLRVWIAAGARRLAGRPARSGATSRSIGVLMQAGYLGGVWSAVKAGIGAGTVALLVGLQPVLTAIWVTRCAAPAGRAQRRRPARQWLGLLLGLAGLALVVWPQARHRRGHAREPGAGRRRPARHHHRHALPEALRRAVRRAHGQRGADAGGARGQRCRFALLEPEADGLAPPSWSARWPGRCCVLTLGGSSLLYLLIQRGEATAVTSLLYLVPPCTAVMAWLLFGEAFTPLMMLGMAFTVVGVAIVVRDRTAANA